MRLASKKCWVTCNYHFINIWNPITISFRVQTHHNKFNFFPFIRTSTWPQKTNLTANHPRPTFLSQVCILCLFIVCDFHVFYVNEWMCLECWHVSHFYEHSSMGASVHAKKLIWNLPCACLLCAQTSSLQLIESEQAQKICCQFNRDKCFGLFGKLFSSLLSSPFRIHAMPYHWRCVGRTCVHVCKIIIFYMCSESTMHSPE